MWSASRPFRPSITSTRTRWPGSSASSWLRRSAGAPLAGDRVRPPALGLLGVLFAASLAVAAVTSAGMAASTAGHVAVPHSGHGGHGSNQPAQNPYLSPGHQGHHH